MSEAHDYTDAELLPERTRGSHGAIERQGQVFQPSQLATLTDEEFTRRIKLAATEVQRMAEIQRSVMKEDIDYGKIPGTNKPTLYQPGAQILNRLAALVPDYSPERATGDGETAPHIAYMVRCHLVNSSGEIVSEGFGAANTWEKKHRYRYNDRECPKCGKPFIFASKQEGQKWFCWAKKGGCGATFRSGAESAEIDAQPAMMENPDPYELENTVLKMACKRAYLAATVNAHACSGIFSQDVEPEEHSEHQPVGQTAQANRSTGKPKQSAAASDDEPISEQQVKMLWATIGHRLSELGKDASEANKTAAHDIILDELGLESFTSITRKQFSDVFAKVKAFSG